MNWTCLRLTFWIVMMIADARWVALAGRPEAETAVTDGNTAYYAGNYQAAEASFTIAITNDPAWAVPYNNRGLARFHFGSFASADADFDSAKVYDTNYVSPYVNKGKSLAAQRRFTEAVAEFQAGINRATNHAGLYYNLGWVLDEQKLYAQAISNYNQSLILNAGDLRPRLARGVTYAKQGFASNAIADFYGVINSASNDFMAALAAYNLQLSRGPGVNFTNAQATTHYTNAVFQFTTEQFTAALANFQAARTEEPTIPDIPWIMSWSYTRSRSNSLADASLGQANALLEQLAVRSIGETADVFIDGIKKGNTPTLLRLFRSGYDISLRRAAGVQTQEWVGVTYTDGTPGGSQAMLLNPESVTSFTPFGPVTDTDRDWLADTWERGWFGSIVGGPDSDATDYDGVRNLFEHWRMTDPTKTDTDGDGMSDFVEIYTLGTSPVVSNQLHFYYVNDASTENDLWCTSPGNDANDGLSPAAPKASVQAVLTAYPLGSGDAVLIDTGDYNVGSNISVTSANSGSSVAPLLFLASPFGVSINRGNSGQGWSLTGNYVRLTTADSTNYPSAPRNWLKLTGGIQGINVAGSNCWISRADVSVNYGAGTCISVQGANSTIENCLTRGYAANGILLGSSARGATVRNCTVSGNMTYGLSTYSGNYSILENNVIAINGAGKYGIHVSTISGAASDFVSDYNDVWAINGARVGNYAGNRTTMLDWQLATGQDRHSFSFDPLWAAPDTGDYHVRSQGGRYDPATATWIRDTVTSPCIDAGNPDSLWADEPQPNGSRINLGVYGGTLLASKSLLSFTVSGSLDLPTKDFILSWNSLPGESYQVLYSTSVAGPWLDDLPGSLLKAGTSQTTLTYTNANSVIQAKRLYRVLWTAP